MTAQHPQRSTLRDMTAEPRPVGIQVIGPRYEDDTALTNAELLAQIVGGYEPPRSA
jgi:Asp-tRNA(Asn)/Glu-tRNA(Gln) amidotransferase A subunit family amidase